MTPVHNRTAGQAPQVGDVISFSVESNFTDDNSNYPGHTAIVSATNVNSSGNGCITIMSENSGDPETATTTALSVGDWYVRRSRPSAPSGLVTTPYIEWLPLGGSTLGPAACSRPPGTRATTPCTWRPRGRATAWWCTGTPRPQQRLGEPDHRPGLRRTGAGLEPGSKTMDVAAEGASNSLVLYQTTSATSTTWTGKTIGQSDNAPALAWNPGNNSMYAAAQGTGNSLVLYWNAPATSATWTSKTIGQSDNAPALAWNSGNNSVSAAAQGASNSLVLYWNTPAVNGAWVNKTIGQAYAAPALAWNPGNSSFYAAAQGTGNSLVLFLNTPAVNGAWVSKTIGQADNAPALAWNTGNKTMYAAAQGTGNNLVLYWNTPAVNGAWVNKTSARPTTHPRWPGTRETVLLRRRPGHRQRPGPVLEHPRRQRHLGQQDHRPGVTARRNRAARKSAGVSGSRAPAPPYFADANHGPGPPRSRWRRTPPAPPRRRRSRASIPRLASLPAGRRPG